MLTMEQQKIKVEEILGTPLPELDPVFYEGAKLYDTTAPNKFITPYMLHEMFTPLEMKLVLQLPGTAQEVAQKLGLNEIEVEAKLDRLLRFGRILPMKKGKPGYAPSVDVMTLRDQLGLAYIAMGLNWNQGRTMFRMMEAWRQMPDPPKPLADAVHGSFRVIPKYASIKNLPGVMYCENIREIMESFQEVDKFAVQMCVCRNYRANMELGHYSADHCSSGFHEHAPEDGHCMTFGTRADYAVSHFGGHFATREEMERCLQEIDQSTAVLSAHNKRQIDFICSCCDDCCAIAQMERDGLPIRIPSRFRPGVLDEQCVGCGMCLDRCVFHALEITDGKANILPDKCMGCGNCVVTCPQKALQMEIVHDVDWVPDYWAEDNNWNINGENTADYVEEQRKHKAERSAKHD